jgi:hypothetical protein
VRQGVDIEEPATEPFSHEVLRFMLLAVFAICLFSLFFQFMFVPVASRDLPPGPFSWMPDWLSWLRR